jgi:hypothetical protein
VSTAETEAETEALLRVVIAKALLHTVVAKALLHIAIAKALLHAAIGEALLRAVVVEALLYTVVVEALLHAVVAEVLALVVEGRRSIVGALLSQSPLLLLSLFQPLVFGVVRALSSSLIYRGI